MIEIVKIVRDTEGTEIYRIIKEDGKYYKTYKKTVRVQRDVLQDLHKTPDEDLITEIVKRRATRKRIRASKKGSVK